MSNRISSWCGRVLSAVAVVTASGIAAVQASAATEVSESAGLVRVGSEHPRLALVLFPGAFVESAKYVELARTIVEQSNDEVSVFIANRFANVTNPIEARTRVQTVINLMSRPGETDVRSRIFLAGHSQGGVAIFGMPVSMDLGGLILLGSYLPRTVVVGQSLADYAKPVLTLGGELDGLTGVNYLAREAETARRLASTDAQVALDKPVVLLPGVNHAQFADGSGIDGDLAAEVDTEAAHAAIAQRVLSFMAIHAPASDQERDAAAEAQRADVEATLELLRPYLATVATEALWCERAQIRSAALVPDAFSRIDFDTKVYRGLVGQGQFVLDKAKVAASGDRFRLHLPVFVAESPGPLDISKDHALSPASMWCKMRSPEAFASETGMAPSGEAPASCAELNQWVIESTLTLLEPRARARLEARYGAVASWQAVAGREGDASRIEYGPFVIKSSPMRTGQAWVAGRFSLAPAEQGWELDTVELKTGLDTWIPSFAGAHYCKLVSPGRVVEWATLFGLKQ